MTKIETLNALREQETARNVSELAQAIEQMRKAKIEDAEDLARMIHPMVTALAQITEETGTTLTQNRDAIATAEQHLKTHLQQSGHRMEQMEHRLTKATRFLTWKWGLSMLLTAVLVSFGLIGLQHWRHQEARANLEWMTGVAASLDSHLRTLQLTLPEAQKEDVRQLYKRLGLEWIEPSEPSRTN